MRFGDFHPGAGDLYRRLGEPNTVAACVLRGVQGFVGFMENPLDAGVWKIRSKSGPMLMLTRTGLVAVMICLAQIVARKFSARETAVDASHRFKTTRNSSPPYRSTIS